MKRLLLPLLAAIALPTAVNANVDPEVHKLCIPAADYLGCVKAMTTKSTDIPSMRIIEGKTELSGNKCPFKYVYVGGGQCQMLSCNMKALNPNLSHLYNRGVCPKTIFGEMSIQLSTPIAKAVYDPKCPDKEPTMFENSSCKDNYYTKDGADFFVKKVKKKKVKTDVSTGSVKINCNSPVWRDSPKCN